MTSGEVDQSAAVAQPHARRWYVLRAAVCSFLVLAVVAVFGQTTDYDFINFDDNIYVYDDSHVARGLTRDGLAWAFSSTHAHFWHPLTTISHMLDVELFGLNRPGGHHLSSVLIHAATAITLFLAILRLTGEIWPSAVVSAIFAVHPLRVESVAWIAERKDVLSGFFFALTLLTYASYVRRPSIVRYLGVALSLSLGLMCKPMLVTVPFVLLLIDYWPLGRPHGPETPPGSFFNGRLLLEKTPLFAIALVASVITVRAQETAIQSTAKFSIQARVANAAVSYVNYLRQTFWPSELAVFYPHPKDGLPEWQVIGAFGVLMLITASVIRARWRRPYLLVGWFWYLGMLVPVIGLTQSGLQARADRFTYLPQIGLLIAIVWWTADVSRNWRSQRWALAPAAVSIVLLLAFLAHRQTGHWRDNETLWTHTLACTGPNSIAHDNLGQFLAKSGRVDEAFGHYKMAVDISPNFEIARYILGNALARRGQIEDAIAQYRKALEINPDYVNAHLALGNLLDSRGQVDEAIFHYQQALRIDPDDAHAHVNLGNDLDSRGQVDEAIFHFRTALKIKPHDADTHYNLGNALANTGRFDEAIFQYQLALEVKPDYTDAHANLGALLARRGQVDEAIDHYQRALEIAPGGVLADKIRRQISELRKAP